MEQHQVDYTGKWNLNYWYPCSIHKVEEVSEYVVNIYDKDGAIILESEEMPNKSYIFARLTIDGKLAIGTWQETTAPEGEFKGAIYSGAFAMLFNEDNTAAEGKVIGNSKEPTIFHGRWQMERI